MKTVNNIMDVQRSNRSMVLEALYNRPGVSRIDLAGLTGLNKATITNIISDYLDRGFVAEIPDSISESGRKVKGLRLRFDGLAILVMRLKADSFQIGLYHPDLSHDSIESIDYQNPDSLNLIMEQVRTAAEKWLADGEKRGLYIIGISAATLGWLYHKDGTYRIKAEKAPVFEDFDLKEALTEYFPEREIWIDHDANMAALAEWDYFIKSTDCTPKSMLSIVGGIGFGGGFVIDGEIYSGFHGIACEVGRLGVNCLKLTNTHYGKGRNYDGIFEDIASPRAIYSTVMENLGDFQETELTPASTLNDIYEAYENGDALAVWAVSKAARCLAYGLTGLIFVLDPEVIVLGDEIDGGEKFRASVNAWLREYVPPELMEGIKIRFSSGKRASVLDGCALAMIRHYFRTGMIVDLLQQI